MAELIRSQSLTGAWRDTVQILLAAAPKHELYDLLVEVSDPMAIDLDTTTVVDRCLEAMGMQSLETVANTIFPERLAQRSPDRQSLYRRYERILPRIRRMVAQNRRGTYFGRLIRYPLQQDPERTNQLELVIRDLERQAPERPMRHIYEMQVFAPGKDRRPMGFPCMSSLSLHLEGGYLRMAATYRNQFWIERGLGNLIGLARLQGFIARQSGLPVGPLSVHAFHAVLDRSPREILARLPDDMARTDDHDGQQGGDDGPR